MNRLTGIIILLICFVCFGCKTISKTNIIIDEGEYSRSINTIAVMHFDDQLIAGKEVEGSFIKTISNANAGEILATMLSHELSRLGIYDVLPRADITQIINKSNAEEKELVSRRDYVNLGNLLGVDSVVIGKILEFKLSSTVIYERGTVSFVAECIDTENGSVLWTIEANESAAYKDEIELAGKAVRTAIEKLKNELR
ncbi:MAG: DUF799 family lipoprotein [Candidatus Kuenenia sp.]|nr:DUF799 family lipoprotein [Candidatus Kuenenia hertensis]